MTSSIMDNLKNYGFSDAIAEQLNENELPARVVRVDRLYLQLVTENGITLVPYPHDGAPVATGDWLALRPDGQSELSVARILPRISQLVRKAAFDNSSDSQLLAANVDLIGIVVPIDRPVSANRMERMLVAAWDSGGTPLIVLTKADLGNMINGNQDVVADVVRYSAGAEVFTTSSELGDGIEALRERIRTHGGLDYRATLTLLGPSGAGKSSLVNALIGDEIQDTGEVREGDYKGKHTTTARELVPLPGSGVLMDSPGVRGFAVFDADDGISAVFGDIEALFGNCRFGDCQHLSEPGCAVQEAISAGELEQRRWLSFQKMQREMTRLAARKDSREAAVARAGIRNQGRDYKNFKKIRERAQPGRR